MEDRSFAEEYIVFPIGIRYYAKQTAFGRGERDFSSEDGESVIQNAINRISNNGLGTIRIMPGDYGGASITIQNDVSCIIEAGVTNLSWSVAAGATAYVVDFATQKIHDGLERQIDLDMGGNDIDNPGNIGGISITSHSTRHEEGGADEVIPSIHNSRHENGGADEIDVGGLSGLLADDQTPLPHGPSDHSDRTREVFLGPNAMQNDGFSYVTDVNWYSCLELGADADGTVKVNMKVPEDFVSFDGWNIVWSCPSTGNLYCRAYSTYAASGEDKAVHTDSSSDYATLANGGADVLNIQQDPEPLTMPDLAKGDVVGFTFERLGSNANDTLDDVFRLLGIIFEYTADQ